MHIQKAVRISIPSGEFAQYGWVGITIKAAEILGVDYDELSVIESDVDEVATYFTFIAKTNKGE